MASTSIPLEGDLTLFRDKLVALKRRQARRFRCGLATLGKVQFPGKDNSADAFVYNLSESGIGLNMSEPLESGKIIIIRIRVSEEPQPYLLNARVVHSTQEVDCTWRVGCEFGEPLGPDLLEKILG